MQKEKTVDVMCCDFCISEDVPTRKCDHCGKDACDKCCHVYSVTIQRPVPLSAITSGTFTMSLTSHIPAYRATFCDECGKNEISILLMRADFKDTKQEAAA